MERIKYISICLLCLLMFLGNADLNASVRSKVNKGNELFKEDKFKEAYQQYSQAQIESPDDPYVYNNMGLSLYKMNKFKEAEESFLKAGNSARLTEKQKSQVMYNLGNTYARMKDYDKAIDAYKKSIELNNSNSNAKYNLIQVKKLQKKQSEKQKNNKNNKRNNKENNKNKDKQNKGTEKNQNNKKRQNRKPGNDKNKQEQSPEKKRDISKEDARRILEMLSKEQRKNPPRINREIEGELDVEKDW